MVLPYMKGMSERIARTLGKHNINNIWEMTGGCPRQDRKEVHQKNIKETKYQNKVAQN